MRFELPAGRVGPVPLGEDCPAYVVCEMITTLDTLEDRHDRGNVQITEFEVVSITPVDCLSCADCWIHSPYAFSQDVRIAILEDEGII